jgi:hypothetical protein
VASEFEEFLTEGMDAGAWVRVDPPRRLSTEEESLIATLAHAFAGTSQLLQAQLPSARVLFVRRALIPAVSRARLDNRHLRPM